jgi:hypothetical protein
MFIGRKWISQIQNELVLVSSLEQSADAIAFLYSNLQGNHEYCGTAQCLEDLSFYRMSTEWRDISKGGLSAFMVMIQEAQGLGMAFEISMVESPNQVFFAGPGPVARFERVLLQKIKRMMIRDPFSKPQLPLHAARRIRSAVDRRNPGDFYCSVRDFAAQLNQADKSSLGSFHTILSVLEFAVTYVLFIANPHKGIVLPWSWAMLHLPRIMQSQVLFSFTSKEIRTHLSALTIINAAFAALLEQTNGCLEKGILRFHAVGRVVHDPTPMNIIVKRRCTELLTTIIVNMDTWPNQSLDYRDMKKVAYSTLRSNMPQGMSLEWGSNDKFRQSCIRGYKPYNDKDGLCVITLDDEEPAPPALRPFVHDKAQFSTLSDVLTLAKLAAIPQITGQGETPQGEDYTENELKEIIKVQQRWRKVMSASRINRQYRQTRTGHYTTELVEICSRVFGIETALTWPFAKKLFMRKVIFTDVFKLIMSLEGVLDHLRELVNEWRQEFNNNHSIAKLEELTLIRDKIMYLDGNIENLRCDWALGGIRQMVLSTAYGKVSSSARKAQRTVMAAGEEIEETLLRIGVVAETNP